MREPSFETQLFAMDTYMTFSARGERSKEAVEAAAEEVRRLEKLFSVSDPSGEVYRLNEQGGGSLSEDTALLLKRGMKIFESTDGLFDVTVYLLMELWGFPTKEYRVPSEEELYQTLKLTGSQKISFDGERLLLSQGQKIDFGGIAKGYASDRVMEIYHSYGIENGMVSLGGNVYAIGTNGAKEPWNIGIRNPKGGANDVIGSIRVSGKAVVTSGGYERYFEQDGHRYIHILNPKTGLPAEGDLLSVTIVSEDGTLADAMSTAVYLMGNEKARDYWRTHGENFEMILITDQEKIYVTEGISEDFRSDKTYETIYH